MNATPEPSDPKEVEAAVRAILQAAGLPVLEHEFQAFVAMYPALRAGADSLYAEAVRYEEPALIFTPVPPAKA